MNDRRRYIRHPSGIPIEVVIDQGAGSSTPLKDVGLGGLCFQSARPLDRGVSVRVRIPHVRPPFEAWVRVCWCCPAGDAHLVGAIFLDVSEAVRARMVEQVCHIEAFRRVALEKEGRRLTSFEAASEWIAKYATDFPHPEDARPGAPS